MANMAACEYKIVKIVRIENPQKVDPTCIRYSKKKVYNRRCRQKRLSNQLLSAIPLLYMVYHKKLRMGNK
jgi:hypothetical protein